MKKLTIPEGMEKRFNKQEILQQIEEDLLTVLESYMNEIEPNEVFYHCIRFMTSTLYAFNDNHREALKVLRMAMDQGIHAAMEERGH